MTSFDMSTDPKPIDLVLGALETGLDLAKQEMARRRAVGDEDTRAEVEARATALRVAMALCGREATLPDTASLAAALTSAIAIADEAVTEWDRAPSGARPGKILMALAGHLPGYRKDTDLVHAALHHATARNVAAGIAPKVEEIVGHLGAILMQTAPSDDQIIIDHVRKAHELATALRRQQ
jgi:hypothetical protein